MIEVNQKNLMEGIRIDILNVAASGEGKTYLAHTFPKVYSLITSRGEEQTWMSKPELRKNVVGYDYLCPENVDDTKRIFGTLNEDGEIHKFLKEAKQLYKEGKISTLVVDSLTPLCEDLWLYLNKYQCVMTREGAIDTRAMYGNLARQLYKLVRMGICTFPGNLVVNVHEMLEDEDTMNRKPKGSNPIVPTILGGFRDKIGGLFSYVFYLMKLKKGDTYEYYTRTNKGNSRSAKSRFSLPEVIKDVSYDVLVGEIEKSLKQGGK